MVRRTCGSFARPSCARVGDGAARRRVGDAEPHLVADREFAPDPVVLDEALLSLWCGDRHIGAEAARIERRFRTKLGEARHRRRGYEMKRRIVGEPACHHQLADIDDGLFFGERVEAFEAGRFRALRRKRDRPPQGFGEAGIRVTAIAGDRRAVGPEDAHRGQRRAGLRRSDEIGGEGHQLGPVLRGLGAPNPAARAVDYGIGSVAQNAALGDQRLAELGARHGLDRIAPERLDRAAVRAMRCHDLSPRANDSPCQAVLYQAADVSALPHQGSSRSRLRCQSSSD